tara:strand:- start:289 stop:687 length:399 start_codon:yes stop_codon:yes gene_type:complete
MKIEDSTHINLEHEEVILPFGKFYFFKHFVISEINEGVHFDWNKVKITAEIMTNHYGAINNLTYISNRINSYSIEPQSWLKFDRYQLVKSTGIVAYDKKGGISVVLERLFSKGSIKIFRSLKKAIEWASLQD